MFQWNFTYITNEGTSVVDYWMMNCTWIILPLQIFLFDFSKNFWPCHMACKILVSWPRIKPLQQKLSLNHWTAREGPRYFFYKWPEREFSSVQFSSVTQSCLTLCDPMNRSTPGLPVHYQLLESTQTHVRCVGDASNHLTLCCPFSSYLQPFPALGSFQMSQLFASGGQSIGVSASTSVLPMNTQDWSPLGWTGWISLQSKGLSRVFSNTTDQTHQFFGVQLSL